MLPLYTNYFTTSSQMGELVVLIMRELIMISIIIMGQLFKIANACTWSKLFFFKACMKEDVV